MSDASIRRMALAPWLRRLTGRSAKERAEAGGGLARQIEALAQDLRYNARVIRRAAPLSIAVVLTLIVGLGMNAVRQLIAVNTDLHATRAELADLAVAADRERLGRELHDLLARTLSLIAVKAELASRLSARSDRGASAELSDVQRLARQAVRDVRHRDEPRRSTRGDA